MSLSYYKEMAKSYQETLDEGCSRLAEAMGVSAEFFDQDAADIHCYSECISKAAELLKAAGASFNEGGNGNTQKSSDPDCVQIQISTRLFFIVVVFTFIGAAL